MAQKYKLTHGISRNKVFWAAKSKFSRVRRQPMEQEEICVKYTSERINVKIMLRIQKKRTIKNKAINPVNKRIHELGSSQKKCPTSLVTREKQIKPRDSVTPQAE